MKDVTPGPSRGEPIDFDLSIKEKEPLPDGVLCPEHGQTPSMNYTLNSIEIGRYCFICFNDFVGKNIKNHVLIIEAKA